MIVDLENGHFKKKEMEPVAHFSLAEVAQFELALKCLSRSNDLSVQFSCNRIALSGGPFSLGKRLVKLVDPALEFVRC